MIINVFFIETAPVHLKTIMQFITGSSSMTPCFVTKLKLYFKHDCPKSNSGSSCACYPSSSTCALSLTIPVHLNTFDIMLKSFEDAILITKAYGFGKH